MKRLISIILILNIFVFFQACNPTGDKNADSNEVTYGQSKVEVFYFHRTRRCPQCLTVEEVVTEFINTEYTGKDVKYFSVDYENDENHDISSKYSIRQTSLLITSGNESTDLTKLALQVVMSDPEQLRIKMREIINSYLTNS